MTYDVRPNWKTARINGVRRIRRHMQINPRISVLFGIAGLASGVCNAQIANLWVGFLITAFSICIAAVGCLSVALWLLTGRWENREFVLLVLAGIGTTWNSLVVTLLLLDFGWSIKLNGQDWTYFLALAVVGEPVFLIISAKWILKS